MASFKPLIGAVVLILLVGFVLNVFISPFVDTTSPVEGSVLNGFIEFIENGWDININIPIFGSVSTNISPVSWLWLGIDGVTDFVGDQLTLMTYIPDLLLIPLLIMVITAFAYVIVTLIRGN